MTTQLEINDDSTDHLVNINSNNNLNDLLTESQKAEIVQDIIDDEKIQEEGDQPDVINMLATLEPNEGDDAQPNIFLDYASTEAKKFMQFKVKRRPKSLRKKVLKVQRPRNEYMQ